MFCREKHFPSHLMKPMLKTWQKLVTLQIISSVIENLDLSVMYRVYKLNEKPTYSNILIKTVGIAGVSFDIYQSWEVISCLVVDT